MSAFPECSPRCAPVSLERLSSHPPRHLANSNALVTEILIMKNHVHQGFMHADALLVFNEAKIAKAIHEEADSGPRCADHFCEGLLRNLGNQCFWIALLADFGHEQKNPGQTPFAVIEDLIDQIGLNAHAALQQK